MLTPGRLSPFPRTGGVLNAAADGRKPTTLEDGAQNRDLVQAFGFHGVGVLAVPRCVARTRHPSAERTIASARACPRPWAAYLSANPTG